MKQTIENILSRCADILKQTGTDFHEAYDLLLTLVFWQYISDDGNNPKSRFLFCNARFDNTENAVSKIDQTIKTLLQNMNESFESELRIRTLSNETINELSEEFRKLFDANWQWSDEHVSHILNFLDQIFIVNSYVAHEFINPKDITSLMPSLVNMDNVKTVYDPFCRTGEFLWAAAHAGKHVIMTKGYTPSRSTLKVAHIKAIMLYRQSPALNYDLKQNTINTVEEKLTFDLVLSNPPFNVNSSLHAAQQKGNWLGTFAGIKMEIDVVCHALDHLNDNGQAAIIVPSNMLFSSGKMKEFRQKLISKNVLEAVIQLPPNIFYGTKVIAAILVFNTNKNSKNTLLFDAARLGTKQKERHEFSGNDIMNIANAVSCHREGRSISDSEYNGFALEVSPIEFALNDYIFLHSIYEPEETKKIHRKTPEEIWKEQQYLKRQFEECYEKIMQLTTSR